MSTHKPDTRSRILEAVLSLVADDPETGLRMADIAKRAGISRQALYLHFATRTDLLVATTLYVDHVKDIDARLAASRAAKSGAERLAAYIDAWGNYIPEIYAIARVLLALKDSGDAAAAAAWDRRMAAMREGCAAAINTLKSDGLLSPEHPRGRATDLLWTMLSVRNWEQLTIDCGWSQKAYIANLKNTARQLFVAAEARQLFVAVEEGQ
jgi:AcrR family transcriptional regulator